MSQLTYNSFNLTILILKLLSHFLLASKVLQFINVGTLFPVQPYIACILNKQTLVIDLAQMRHTLENS